MAALPAVVLFAEAPVPDDILGIALNESLVGVITGEALADNELAIDELKAGDAPELAESPRLAYSLASSANGRDASEDNLLSLSEYIL
jgi:hypothetical protein